MLARPCSHRPRLGGQPAQTVGQGKLALGEPVARTLQDDEAAVQWFRRSAEQGRAHEQTSLGWMYEQGRGVRRDRLEAARWYPLAADQGHADAQRRLDGLR